MSETVECQCWKIYDEIAARFIADIAATFNCPRHGQVTIDKRPIPASDSQVSRPRRVITSRYG